MLLPVDVNSDWEREIPWMDRKVMFFSKVNF